MDEPKYTTSEASKNRKYYFKFKRISEFIFALVLLIVTSPLTLIAIICIMIESPGNPFYVQKRMGLLGREFSLFKLRSMYKDSEKSGIQWAQKNDPRVTKVGNIIRKNRIDELPQLLNIILGNMALIGPRPERKQFVEEFTSEIPDFPKRMKVKPGLTGWAQINGGYDITPEEKLKLDLYYIRNVGLRIDSDIFIKTIKIVLTGDGAR